MYVCIDVYYTLLVCWVFTHIDLHVRAQMIKSILDSQVSSQAIAGIRAYDTHSCVRACLRDACI